MESALHLVEDGSAAGCRQGLTIPGPLVQLHLEMALAAVYDGQHTLPLLLPAYDVHRFCRSVIYDKVPRCYDAVNFLQNPHKRHPIPRPLGRVMGRLLCVQTLMLGRGMGCLLCVQTLILILPQTLQ